LAIQIGLFILGLLVLYLGAEWLVKGSSRLAQALGVKPIVIGLTIVAFGTSSPEFVVSLLAALKKSEGIAIGNIIGSNIANVGLILGISALVSPLKVELGVLRRELPVMIGVSLLFTVMLLDQKISFWNGLILFSGLLGYIGYHFYNAMKVQKATDDFVLRSKANQKIDNETTLDENGSRLENTLLAIVGLALLVGGANLMVRSGVLIARKVGVSEIVIGLTLVSVGTSLPELATSVVSARRKESDISVGNVIGSNIFNIMCVIGIVGMVAPLDVDRGLLFFELPVMLLFSVALFPLMKTGNVLNRIEGAILLVGYGIFIICLF